ncbi:peptidoglycan recognition protein family protein [Pseudonocardia sp. T1-2H]|uniref:peptidoglycan recognition protein family protein n=1 Tax=Pseudonocardia sp. T1-2H TaxID=3128899 RepID=UPI0031012902
MSRRGLMVGGLAVGGLSLVSTGTAAADPALRSASPDSGALAEAGPAIVPCPGWGARPNNRIVPIWNQRPVKVLVHHTASPNQANTDRGAADALARSIQNYHMDRRRWLDSGQHFTISRGGFVLEGRHRSLEVLRGGRKQVEGAHCTGQNVVAVGIENEGIYVDVGPPPALWNSLRNTCAYICAQYGIAPTELYGHRDFKNTACPGDRLYGMLPRLRGEVAGILGRRLEAEATVKASWPLVRPGDSGATVLAVQHLLRDAGHDVPVDGAYSPAMTATVRRFQTETKAEDANGIIGGESWPVLARTVRRGEGSEAEKAVNVLAEERQVESVPDVVEHPEWQELLGTSGEPADTSADPVGPPR